MSCRCNLWGDLFEYPYDIHVNDGFFSMGVPGPCGEHSQL